MPEELVLPVLEVKRQRQVANPVPRCQRMSKDVRAAGTKQLRELRDSIYFDPSAPHTQTFAPEMYLPDTVVKDVLDRLTLIDTKDALRDAIATRFFLLPYIDKGEEDGGEKEERKRMRGQQAFLSSSSVLGAKGS